MADARIRVEVSAESAKKKLKEFERGKKKAEKKAELAEKRKAKEQAHKERMDKYDRRREQIERAGTYFRDPLGVAKGAVTGKIAGRFSQEQRDVASKAVAIATAAFETARSANDAASMIGGALKEQGGVIGKLVGEPLAGVAEDLKVNVFDQASRLMEAAKISATTQASFAKAGIVLDADAMAGISEFSYKEGARRSQIETRERERSGAVVSRIIAEMTGFGK